jgi:hypothetical protein
MDNLRFIIFGFFLTFSIYSYGEEVILDCKYSGDERSWEKSRDVYSQIVLVETEGNKNIYNFNKETLDFSMETSGCADVAINKVFCALPHNNMTYIDRRTLEVKIPTGSPTLPDKEHPVIGQCSLISKEDMNDRILSLKESMSKQNKF